MLLIDLSIMTNFAKTTFMEIYNKEKHHDLVLEHMKQAALENRQLDMYPCRDNYGREAVELVISETDSILLNGEDFEYLRIEATSFAYHEVMMKYIAPADERTKLQQFAYRIPQGHTSKDYKKRRIELKPAEGLLPEEKGSIWTKTSDKLPPEGETVIVLCNDKFHPKHILYASFDRSQQMWTSGETTTFQFTSKHGQYWCPVSVFEV